MAQPQPSSLTAEQQKQELIAFTVLFSLFERAYLRYYDHSDRIRATQWTGWDEYIHTYCARANFRRAWSAYGSTYDKDFEAYMRGQIDGTEADGTS